MNEDFEGRCTIPQERERERKQGKSKETHILLYPWGSSYIFDVNIISFRNYRLLWFPFFTFDWWVCKMFTGIINDEELINLVEQRPHLYNRSLKENKLKENSWISIAEYRKPNGFYGYYFWENNIYIDVSVLVPVVCASE